MRTDRFVDVKVNAAMEQNSKRSGKPRRSKGCTSCIKRKVKCDEQVPSCGQCLKGGRTCSGIAAAIFMNTDSTTLATTSTFAPRTHSTALKKGNEERLVSSSGNQLLVSHRPGRGTRAIGSVNRRLNKKRGSGNKASSVSTLPLNDAQISAMPPSMKDSHVLSQAFLSNFIIFYSRGKPSQTIFNSWMGHLPNFLASTRSTAVIKAIRAASMAYCARERQDQSILLEAFKWYGSGLTSQRIVIESINKAKREPTVEELSTPILLAFFEGACCTSQTAYFQHIVGAAHLMKQYGPQRCSQGMLFEMYHTLRLQLIYPMYVMRLPSVLGGEEWLTMPYVVKNKTVLDRIIDIITLTSGLLCRIDQLKEPQIGFDTYHKQQAIKSEGDALKAQLDGIWDEIRDRASVFGWKGDYFEGIPGIDNIGASSNIDRAWQLEADALSPCESVTPRTPLWKEPVASRSLPEFTNVDIPQVTEQTRNFAGDPSSEDNFPIALSPSQDWKDLAAPDHDMFETGVHKSGEGLYGKARVQGLSWSSQSSFSLNSLPKMPNKGPASRPLAFYSAARMIVLSILDEVGPRPVVYEEQMEAHSACIFAVAQYMTNLQIGYAYIRLVMALHVVGKLSPRVEQRREARRFLALWGKFDGMQGICEVALRSLGMSADDKSSQFSG